MKSRFSSAAQICGLLLLTAGISCSSLTISGKGTGGAPGSPCTDGKQCASGDCSGNCCTFACLTTDPICGALGCNDTGACIYPTAATTCPQAACSDARLYPMACNGAGVCQPIGTGTACPGNLGCGPGEACLSVCSSAADCVSGFVCNGGACVKPIATGMCTEDDDCKSGICGVAGTGNCCSTSCVTDSAVCGSTGCDASGACLYPASTVSCGPGATCADGMQTNASLCDGAGHCGEGAMECSPFTCGSNACKTTCTSNTDCVAGAFCDLRDAGCCATLAGGSALAVDSVLGDDAAPCCGYGSAVPCRTLSHAMSLVEAGPSANTVLRAAVNGSAFGDWTPAGELYPIALGWGVELSAPGIFFAGPDAGLPAIFELAADAGGAESASIVGTEGNPVGIGTGQLGSSMIFGAAISDGPGSTLYLADVSIYGSSSAYSYAILASSSTLVLGQDRSGAITGTVQIGTPQTKGWTGIECDGCTLSDAPMNGTSSLVIVGQFNDLYATGSASLSLKSAPILGVAPASLGFNTCPSKPDQTGITLSGSATMSLDQATIQCMPGDYGIQLMNADGDGGTPSATVNGTTIQNTQLALGVWAGSAVVSNSTIRYNASGVIQGTQVFTSQKGSSI